MPPSTSSVRRGARRRPWRTALRGAQSANAAKTEFLARMSHELRTPLNAVLGFAQLLDDRSEPLTPRQQRNVRLLRDGGQHLLALINDVLDVASIEAGRQDIERRPVALDEVVEASIASCAISAERAQVRVEARLPDGPALHVSADPTRLRQVLANLLSNGIKYNRSGGRVTVTATATEERVRIVVVDDGLGLTPEQQRNLFTPYDRLGRERSGIVGTGIGLVLARQLVELMGGTLTLSSEADRGTTVIVDLVRSDAAPVAAGKAATMPGRLGGGGLVLYIEDEPVNQLLVQETLRSCADIELLMADNGRQGLALARKRRPDLVLLDMQLPDMNGPQVMQALRDDAATRQITVVALSAGAMSQDIALARAAGAIEYWTKPFDVAKLRADVRRILSAA
ncbi:MAG: ATP-binding protein [Rubrivivax sp.]